MEAGTDVKVMLSRSATRRALLPQSGFGERGDGSLGGEGLIVQIHKKETGKIIIYLTRS